MQCELCEKRNDGNFQNEMSVICRENVQKVSPIATATLGNCLVSSCQEAHPKKRICYISFSHARQFEVIVAALSTPEEVPYLVGIIFDHT